MPVDERADDGGFSLIEVLVSITLFTVVAVSTSMALVTATTIGENTDNRVVAAGLASGQLEQLRAAASPAAITSGTGTLQRNGAVFTIKRDVAKTCAADNKRVITVTVSWSGGTAPIHADTVRAC